MHIWNQNLQCLSMFLKIHFKQNYVLKTKMFILMIVLEHTNIYFIIFIYYVLKYIYIYIYIYLLCIILDIYSMIEVTVSHWLKLTKSWELLTKVTENPILTDHFIIFSCSYEDWLVMIYFFKELQVFLFLLIPILYFITFS